MPDLMGMKNILVINDEAHHGYREKRKHDGEDDVSDLKGDEKKEAEQNSEAARLWITGIEAVNRIRCLVSVSMLTEGWDANTVTHVLGVRAFGLSPAAGRKGIQC